MIVKLWMTPNPVTAGPATPAAEVLAKMQERNFRRMPVVEGERLVGIVTRTDLTSALQYIAGRFDKARQKRDFSKILVGNVMTPSPHSVRSDVLLSEVARLMSERKLGGIPVVDGGRLVGIITDSDVFRAFLSILGFSLPGTRLTFVVRHDPAVLQEVISLSRAHGLDLHSLATSCEYARGEDLVMIHVAGEGADAFEQDLNRRGVRILHIDRRR